MVQITVFGITRKFRNAIEAAQWAANVRGKGAKK